MPSSWIPQILWSKFYSPFPIFDCIGTTVYLLQLQPTTDVHYVFHVSQLKLFLNPHDQPVQHLLAPNIDAEKFPMAILERKMVKQGHIGIRACVILKLRVLGYDIFLFSAYNLYSFPILVFTDLF